MGRRSGFSGLINAMAREAARQARYAEADRKRRVRATAKAERDKQRTMVQLQKEARIQYIEDRAIEADDMNEELEERIAELRGILAHTLEVDDTISFDSLRIKEKYKPFKPPAEVALPLQPPNKDNFIAKPPSFFEKLIPGSEKRYIQAQQAADSKYQEEQKVYEDSEQKRKIELEKLQREYDEGNQSFLTKVKERDEEVNTLISSYNACDPDAVITYNTMVLERSSYPDDFPQVFRTAYVPESKELIIDYELPIKEIVPTVAEYKYVKSKDEITEKSRKIAEIKELYQDIVAALTLRTLHEVFEADQGNVLDVIVFSGYVNTVDPATGKDITPYLISVRVTKETFSQLALAKIDKLACLRNLGAQVSPRPTELQPVKPIVEFDMVDKRFVDDSDILGSIESRPNLMDLNPFEFEHLVTNLFTRMGLEAKLTRSSRDGGVDCVAFDTRPIVGGKVVIQAKRYKNTVGVSAVRDLYGTMMNEGANKGILVTTSGYGPDAFDFAKDKPIELIDGGGLLYLLDQNGIKARIIFPED